VDVLAVNFCAGLVNHSDIDIRIIDPWMAVTQEVLSSPLNMRKERNHQTPLEASEAATIAFAQRISTPLIQVKSSRTRWRI
jgi:hypothetical protein